jgi:predicted DNA-binding transcriptional regulator YafY
LVKNNSCFLPSRKQCRIKIAPGAPVLYHYAHNPLCFQRYRLIDEIISRYPRQFSKQKLFELCQDKCGIRSMSSLEKDIQRLREDHDAPIAYCKRRNGYYYTNPQFRLLRLMLSPDDMEALDYAREVLAATQGASVADELTNALQKVRQSLDIIREVKTDALTRRIVYVEERVLGGNRHYVPMLIRAINQNRQIQFRLHQTRSCPRKHLN